MCRGGATGRRGRTRARAQHHLVSYAFWKPSVACSRASRSFTVSTHPGSETPVLTSPPPPPHSTSILGLRLSAPRLRAFRTRMHRMRLCLRMRQCLRGKECVSRPSTWRRRATPSSAVRYLPARSRGICPLEAHPKGRACPLSQPISMPIEPAEPSLRGSSHAQRGTRARSRRWMKRPAR